VILNNVNLEILHIKPDTVVYAYKPSKQEAEEEDHKFEASLGYTVKPCL
jgi:hypothetical protein